MPLMRFYGEFKLKQTLTNDVEVQKQKVEFGQVWAQVLA